MHVLPSNRQRPERRQVGLPPPKGSLNDYLVPELILGLKSEKATGTLILEREGTTKIVYIRKGDPIFIDSNLRTETFGHFLVRQGKLTFCRSTSNVLTRIVGRGRQDFRDSRW